MAHSKTLPPCSLTPVSPPARCTFCFNLLHVFVLLCFFFFLTSEEFLQTFSAVEFRPVKSFPLSCRLHHFSPVSFWVCFFFLLLFFLKKRLFYSSRTPGHGYPSFIINDSTHITASWTDSLLKTNLSA